MATKKPTYTPKAQEPLDFDRMMAELSASQPAQAEPPKDGMMRRYVGDTAASVAKGAVTGVRLLSDVAGADNPVSTGLRSVEDFIGGLQSASAKADQQQMAAILKEAEGKGVLDQVVAGAKAFGVAPLQTMAQAAGTSIPTLAAAFIPGVGPAAMAARTAAGLGVGAAQGMGGVKSAIYDEVKQAALQAGAAPDEAERRATWAQSYDGPNAAQIALGAGLGAWAGRSGIEGALDRLVHGTAKAAPGMVARVGLGALAEGIPEAAQGGQEKYASNTALNNAGFPTDPWSGVAANATMEGLAGHAMGGAMGIPNPSAPPVVDPAKKAADAIRAGKLPESGPMTRAANAGTEAQAQAAETGLGPLPTLTEEGEQAALSAIEAQGGKDAKGLKQFAAQANRAAGPRPGAPMQPGQAAEPMAEPTATVTDTPFGDRVLTLQEQLADQNTRQALRDEFGDEALNQATYYASIADRPDVQLPERTRDNMLALAERMVQMALLKRVDRPGLEGGTGAAPQQITGPDGAPLQIGLDTTPTGTIRVDGDGNAAPETEADAINTRQAAAAGPADERQGRRASAVYGEPGPAPAPQQLALPYDTAPSGRMIAGPDGVAPETNAEAINRRQEQAGRDAEAQRRADLGLTPDVQAVQDRNALGRAMPGDILNPKGEPFKNQRAAITAQKKAKGGKVLQVAGGWVVRPEAADQSAVAAPRSTTEATNAQAPAVPAAAAPAAQQEGTDRPRAGEAAPAATGATGAGAAAAPAVEAAGVAPAPAAKKAAKKKAVRRVYNPDGSYYTTDEPATAAQDDGWVEGNDSPNPNHKTWTKKLDDGREVQVVQTAPRSFVATNAAGRPGSGAFGTLAEAKAAAKPSPAPAPASSAAQDGAKKRGLPAWVATAELTTTDVRADGGDITGHYAGQEIARVSMADAADENSPATKAFIETMQKRWGITRNTAPDTSVQDARKRRQAAIDARHDAGNALRAAIQKAKGEGATETASKLQDVLMRFERKDAGPKVAREAADNADAMIRAELDKKKPAPAPAPAPAAPERDWSKASEDELWDEIDRLEEIARERHAQQLKAPLDSEERADLIREMDAARKQAQKLRDLIPEEKQADEPEEPKFGEPGYEPPVNWQTSLYAARLYAKDMGIPYEGEGGYVGLELPGVLKLIQAKLGGKPAAKKAGKPKAEKPDAAPAPAPAPAPAAGPNTIFTEEAAAAARARLKAKLGRLNSGIDPETMLDGITIAGYHIERGARSFVAYVRAMVADLGDGVKPYLQSWYMAVRADPRAAGFKADMAKASDIEDFTEDDIGRIVAAASDENVVGVEANGQTMKYRSQGGITVGDRVEWDYNDGKGVRTGKVTGIKDSYVKRGGFSVEIDGEGKSASKTPHLVDLSRVQRAEPDEDTDAEPDPVDVVNGKAPAPNLPADKRLILMPCSQMKADKPAPAMDLYTGVFFQTLKAQSKPGAQPHIVILSAEHGFLNPTEQVAPYDTKMTFEGATKMLANLRQQMSAVEWPSNIEDVLIVGGKDYQRVMRAAVKELIDGGSISASASINATAGEIGVQRSQLGSYLQSIPDAQPGEDGGDIEQPKADEDMTLSGDVLMPAEASALDLLQDDVRRQVDGESQREAAMFGPQPVRKSFPRAKGEGKGGPLKLPAGVEVLTPEQAKARVEEWKAEAKRQGRESAGKNAQYGVLSLFDTTGMMAKPWVEAGYTVYTYDIQDGQDINEFSAENLLEQHGNDNIMVVIAQPPCTDFASSGARWWAEKDADGRTEASNELVRQVLRTVDLFRPAVWAMENPVGRIAEQNKLPEPTAAFDPWHFGDDYTKRTQFFGRFNPDMPTAPVFPAQGSLIHKMSSSAQKERSDTPEGIAYAFFMANNFEAMGPAGRLAAEFAGVERQLFEDALAAGVDEFDVRSAVDDPYYENDLDTVREELRGLAKFEPFDFTSTTPPKFAAYRGDKGRWMRDSIQWALSPGKFGGRLTVERMAGIFGDPEKPGHTINMADLNAALGRLTQEGAIKRLPRGVFVLSTDKGAATGPDPETDAAAGDTAPEGETGDERPVQGEGPQALDGVAAEEGGGPEGGGPAGRGAAKGRKRGARSGGRTDGAGVSTPRGGGSGAAGVRAAGAGAGGQGDAGAARGKRRKGAPAPETDASVEPDLFDQPAAVPPAPVIPAANFVITPDLKLGQGGEAEKFRDNIAAIRVLKTIERENRRATADEQRILARYVGWGGLPNAFPNPLTKEFKPDWKARGEELRDLLTPKEHRRASNSTTDAHYTSEVVTTAVWDAVRRLGYRGGLALEMSMGTGNFLGLMPEQVAGRTKFIGVELDSITARIARALYPQSTVLESGMQYVPLAANGFDLDIGNPPFGDVSLTWQYNPAVRGLSIHNQFFVAGLDALKPGGIQAKVVSRYLLDAQDMTTRKMLAVKGKLLGAIRLPETAFKTNARTEVVTDIVFIQRRTKEDEADAKQALEWLLSPMSPTDFRKLTPEGKERYTRLTEKYKPEFQWIGTTKVRDPLGGEPMNVNRYFAENPGMVVGTMDRSGSMQHGADITVKLDPAADFAAELAKRIERLPEGVMDRSDEAIDAAIERHKTMADALEIAVAGLEPGQMTLDADGKLMQVFERETPEGDFELGRREITAASPWSPSLFMDGEGRWYRQVVKLDEKGNPVKQLKKDGTPGTLNVYEREVFGAAENVPESLRLGETKLERLRDIAKLRDLLKRQLVLEAQDDADGKLEAARAELAAAYDAYVAKHGFVSEPATGNLVNDMPDGALVQALELSFRPAISAERAKKTGEAARPASAKKAPILSRRVVVPYAPPGKANTAADALQISLSERGYLDIERIAQLRDLTAEQASAELTEGDKPLAFYDPELRRLETRDAYLTGEVARKLRAARDAGMARNVEALEAVQPEPVTSDNVTVILGTSWVPPQVYADFAKHLTGGNAVVTFEPLTNSSTVRGQNTTKGEEWAARNSEGRVTINALELLQDALNSQSSKVYYKDADDIPRLHKGDTELAALKRKEIEREFSEWVFADSARRRLLVEKFNEKFNTRVTRQHDGSHLTLPGKVPDSIISLRRHQKNAIWRGISERFMLLDHVVGAGKTFTAIARVMERRRMGLSKKPMIVVPNHMVEQFAADVYRLYPGAKVLAAGKKDFEKRARRRLFGKIATGDWDVVIVPHSSFGFIGLAPETEEAFLGEELRQALEALKSAEADQEEGSRFKSMGVKRAERLVKKIEARIDAVRKSAKDRLLTFEQMGVDDLTVDEAHEFKNLFYSTSMDNVRGMGDSAGSAKAFDLYTKVRYLRSTPTGSVVFMTGTPISNSAVEMYTMMRYLAADELKALGLEHFDAWRAQFVDASTGYEQQMTGGVKEVSRLGRQWGNARSLMDLYYSFTDAVTIEDIKQAYAEDNPGKEFPLPKVKSGGRREVVVPPTSLQLGILQEIFERYDALDEIEDIQERNSERLRLMDAARKISLDPRAMTDRTYADNDPRLKEPGKLAKVAGEVARIYKQWNAEKGTQLIFLDRSVPKGKSDATELKAYDKVLAARDKAMADGDEDAYRDAVEALEKFDANAMEEMRRAQAGGWNAYQQIKDDLIAQGIPAKEIRFIQEAQNDEQKQAMFDAVKAGDIRVLIGSTPRMGAGTNVQDRLVALHHVDVTWKPSDIEQREGRIIRQGNLFATEPTADAPNPLYRPDFEVEVLAYATERTSDASLWALNGMKLKTINGIRKYDGSFTMEFEDEDSLSMAQMAALASGDPLMLERIQLVGEIDKLERQESAHRRRLMGLKDRIEEAQRSIQELPARIEANEKRAEELAAWEKRITDAADARTVTVEGKTFTGPAERFEAVKHALDAAKAQQGDDEKAKFAITIDGKRITSNTGIENAIADALGDTAPFEATIFGEKEISRAGAVRAIVAKARELAINLGQGQSEGFDIGDVFGVKLVGDVSRSAWGEGNYHITFSLLDADGRTLTSHESRDGAKTHDLSTQFVRATFDKVFSGSLSEGYRSSASWHRGTLRQKTNELPELERQLSMAGPFKQAGELAQKRERLEEVTRLLSGAGTSVAELDEMAMLFGGDPVANTTDVVFSRGEPDEQPDSGRAAAVESLVKAITSRWANAPEVVVVESLADPRVPDAVRREDQKQRSQGASGQPEGFFYGGKVYLVAPQLAGDADVVRVLFHEALGHYGLRGVFGQALGTILDRVAVLQASKVRAKAKQYGLDFDKQSDRRAAAEEVLAELAQTSPTLGWGQKAIAAVRTWLRQHIPGFRSLALTDAEIVRSYILPARAFVQRGGPGGGGGGMRFSRRQPSLRKQLMARGVQPKSVDDALRAMSNGARVFYGHDMEEDQPTEAFKVSDIDGYTADQIIVLPPEGVAFSRSQAGGIADAVRNFDQAAARNLFIDAVTTHGGTNLWGRTVGTQYHKAKTNPTTFGRVFDAVQDYIKDTSVFANRAADKAPSLLPKLDSWLDLKKGGWRHHGAKPEDTAKAGEAIFRGTLDKVIYEDGQLRSEFGLNDLQIGLYREFRAAVDESLDGLGKAEVVRLAGKDGADIAQAVLDASTALEGASLMSQYLTEAANDQPPGAERDRLKALAVTVGKKATRVAQLKAEGYAPLMRFGKHTLHVQREDGSTEFFGMYESVREANQAARVMKADPELAGMEFTQGVMSQEGHKLFNGVSLDALELFAGAIGDEQNPVYQEYLKLAIANRSALKRMIHRKAIKGYSTDVARVLASFVTSNARVSSGNIHLSAAKKMAEAIPKKVGDLRDDAINLVEYVTNPVEEAAAARSLLFTSFIGGSVASALVNMTQPITMTWPYLTQWGGVAKAGKRLLAAAAMVASGKGMDAGLRDALARAEDDGIVSPQEIHHLQAEAMNTLGKHPVLKKAAFVWGAMFSLAEQFNRRVSFVAAYQTAQAEGIADPFEFAESAVMETQGLYNKGNKANWARGPIGATVMTFKQFSTHYLEWLVRMSKNGPEGRKAVAVALALLLLTAGAGGLPFADDLDDLIDTLGQAMGHDTSSKRWKREFVAETLGLGDVAAEVATRGLSALPGMPMDLSLRMGMGNLLPATGLFLRSNTDTARQLLEVAGAAGGLAANVKDGVNKALGGDVVDGAMMAMPIAVQNMAKAAQMWDTGEYRNRQGAKVMDATALDGAMKFVGFQPAGIARESARVGETQRTVQLAKNVEGEIAGRWARALVDGNAEGVKQAKEDLAEWNEKNPKAPIVITPRQIRQRAAALRATRAERTAKAAPKELRPAIAEALK